MSHNMPRCEYCRQIFIIGTRGGCICCGAPAPENQHGILPMPINSPLAILKVKDRLSDLAYEKLRAQWEDLFAGANHPKLVILEQGMDIQFIQQGIMTVNEVRKMEGFDEIR